MIVDCEVEDLSEHREAALHARWSEPRRETVHPGLHSFVRQFDELRAAKLGQQLMIEHSAIAIARRDSMPSTSQPPLLGEDLDASAPSGRVDEPPANVTGSRFRDRVECFLS